jgi:hypothetical protein
MKIDVLFLSCSVGGWMDGWMVGGCVGVVLVGCTSCVCFVWLLVGFAFPGSACVVVGWVGWAFAVEVGWGGEDMLYESTTVLFSSLLPVTVI